MRIEIECGTHGDCAVDFDGNRILEGLTIQEVEELTIRELMEIAKDAEKY